METTEQLKQAQRVNHAAKARLQRAKNQLERLLLVKPIDKQAVDKTKEQIQKAKDYIDALPELPVIVKPEKKNRERRPGTYSKQNVFVVPVEKAMAEDGTKTFEGIQIDSDIAIPLNAVYGNKRVFAYPFDKLNKGDSFTTGMPYEQKHILALKREQKAFPKEHPKEQDKEFLITADANKLVRCWRLK